MEVMKATGKETADAAPSQGQFTLTLHNNDFQYYFITENSFIQMFYWESYSLLL